MRNNKVENTKNNPKPEWLLGLNPSAIEKQEEKGQKELVESSQLPKKINYPKGINVSEIYHKLGIKTFTGSKGDDLFIEVKLPKGWTKKETDHSMWSNLVDEQARIRANLFYKASFHDRDAFINFICKISFRVDRMGFHEGNYQRDENHEYISISTPFCGIVKDFDNTILFKTEEIFCEEKYYYKDGKKNGYSDDYKKELREVETKLEAECLKFLKENYPEYKDVSAYWDEK